jgi:hypothetical protein
MKLPYRGGVWGISLDILGRTVSFEPSFLHFIVRPLKWVRVARIL